MKKLILFFLMCFAVVNWSSEAYAMPLKIVKNQSSVKFFISLNGQNVQGEFKDYDIDIEFDPAHPENTHAEGTVHLSNSTITAANSEVEKEITTAEWLNTKNFPTATFKVTGIEQTTPNYYKAFGTLTLLGKTLPLECYIMISQKNNVYTADVTMLINRLKYGIGLVKWSDKKFLHDIVTVYAHLVTEKK